MVLTITIIVHLFFSLSQIKKLLQKFKQFCFYKNRTILYFTLFSLTLSQQFNVNFSF